MTRSRIFFSLLLSCFLVAGAFSQEFGLSSSTNVGVKSAADPLSLSERLDAHLSLPFDLRGGGLEIRGHVQADALPSPAAFAVDLDQLSLTFVYQKPAADLKALTWTLGRFAMEDPTGLILNHTGDGTKFAFDYNGLNLTIVTAYTGFALRSSSGVALSLADQAKADGLLATPRFVGAVDLDFSLFGRHRTTFSALAQQDLNPRNAQVPEYQTLFDGERGGVVDTQYLTFKLDGPVVDRLFYETFATFGAGTTLSYIKDSPTTYLYQYEPVVSYLAGGSLTFFLPELFSSAFTARVLAASGDEDATSVVEGNTESDSNLFVPVTGTSLGVVFNPALSNLIFYELGATLKPLPGQALVLGAKVLGFQRSVVGVVNAAGVQRLGPLWMGQELDVTVSWSLVSDVSLSASTGVFLPTSGTFAPGTPEEGLQYALKTGVTLSL